MRFDDRIVKNTGFTLNTLKGTIGAPWPAVGGMTSRRRRKYEKDIDDSAGWFFECLGILFIG